jgi:hypothetical protein
MKERKDLAITFMNDQQDIRLPREVLAVIPKDASNDFEMLAGRTLLTVFSWIDGFSKRRCPKSR